MIQNLEKVSQVALTMIPKIGDILIRQLISYCGSASAVFETKPHKLLKIPNIGKVLAENIQNKSVLEKAQMQVDLALKNNAQLLFYTDIAYPKRMKQLYDAPVMLYYKGNADLNQSKIISIVGTRQVTEYGKTVTEQIVSDLSVYNPLIVSGLAYGVDIVAHRSALKNNMQTIGVMASGLDFIYPFQHKATSEAMVNQGGILTEYRFEVQPYPKFFPQRNRIIAGMSDLAIVVEASPKGGALITAEFANNYHRDVFAVPGQIGKSYSEGCNLLIKNNKAQIYTSIKDIVEALNWDLEKPTDNTSIIDNFNEKIASYTVEEAQVLSILKQNKEIMIDDLAWKTQMYMPKLSSMLLNFEFQGIVKSLPGKKYSLS